ncbi:Na/Pi cotransporter family protein [[Clostridium] aminophilum]|uniref:Na/Pi cotransporter family protein n=1 Tax=[Clostridium] aminophilum TaxID=1526 RepID=UPI003F9893B4
MTSIELLQLVGGLIGGLALFLYGMSIMSAGLQQASGGRLETLLAKITKNKIIAYLFGIGVTALVQSSSASTVMVVGLVNSGIMTLHQAVNVILGANLGTTFTAWLLSLNAISSDNLLMNLLKPATFTPFLAITGIGLLMFGKTDRQKTVSSILLGFSVLMFGMQNMSNAVAPLKDSESFVQILMSFSNPVIGFLVGLLFTMVIQSSAGTIGVLQALSLSVHVTYAIALPVVIGAEVGTCITAILSSLGAGKNGKRTALMHLYFNIIKASCAMIIFYSLNAIFHFSFLASAAGMVGIAGIHTLVNLIATPIMLPFSGILAKLALLTIPIDAKEKEIRESEQALAILDDRFLSNPAFALEQARVSAREMAGYAKESMVAAISLMFDFDQETADKVAMLEDRVDHYDDALATYLVKINGSQLSSKDNQDLSVLLHTIGDLERISDHALNVQEIAVRMQEGRRTFSPAASDELLTYCDAVLEIVNTAVDAFVTGNRNLARSVEPLEEVIDALTIEIRQRHVNRLKTGECTVDLGIDLSDLATDLERVGDHCSNIGIDLLLDDTNEFDTHEYLEMVKKEEGPEFEILVKKFSDRYALPKTEH